MLSLTCESEPHGGEAGKNDDACILDGFFDDGHIFSHFGCKDTAFEPIIINFS